MITPDYHSVTYREESISRMCEWGCFFFFGQGHGNANVALIALQIVVILVTIVTNHRKVGDTRLAFYIRAEWSPPPF